MHCFTSSSVVYLMSLLFLLLCVNIVLNTGMVCKVPDDFSFLSFFFLANIGKRVYYFSSICRLLLCTRSSIFGFHSFLFIEVSSFILTWKLMLCCVSKEKKA